MGRWGWSWVNWGSSFLPRFGPFLSREPSKSRFLKPSHSLCKAASPAGSSSNQSHLINLLVFGRSGVSLVCPSSWWQHAQATNCLTRALSHGHLPRYHLNHVGSGPTQLSLGIMPGWGGGWVCTFLLLLHKQMQHGGAPGTGKGTCGNRQGLWKTCNTLYTCSIPVPRDMQHCRVYTRVCTKHTTMQCTYVAPTYK